MPTITELKNAREERDAKRVELRAIFEEAKNDEGQYDFNAVKCLGKEVKGSVAVAEKVGQLNAELDELSEKCESLEKAQKIADDLKASTESPGRAMTHGNGGDGENKGNGEAQFIGIGEAITSHPEFKAIANRESDKTFTLDNYGLKQLKTLMTTAAGWAPESTRIGRVVEAVTRPIQILDLIPDGQTGQAAIIYMEETTRTHSAAEVAEAGTYPEDAFALTERSSTVRKIASWVPVTDEQLEDVSAVSSYLDNRLRFGLRQRLDNQVINGDGNAPNLKGILNTSGILTQATAADPVPDAIHKAMTKVIVTGRAQPGAIVMHPNDWEGIRLLRTADGIYIWGSPQEAGTPRIWGLPIAVSDAIAENTGLVGDFANFSQLFERRGVEIKVRDTHSDDFIKGKQTMRADMRTAFVVFRPAAFATITGI